MLNLFIFPSGREDYYTFLISLLLHEKQNTQRRMIAQSNIVMAFDLRFEANRTRNERFYGRKEENFLARHL